MHAAPWSAAERRAALGLGALLLASLPFLVHPWYDPVNDAAMYIATARSLAAGALIPQTSPDTVADGLLTSLGELTWPIVRDHVEQVITVSDPDILAAMRLVAERMKIVIEPSAAVAVAAVLSRSFGARTDPGRVGVVLSGGNVDLARLG